MCELKIKPRDLNVDLTTNYNEKTTINPSLLLSNPYEYKTIENEIYDLDAELNNQKNNLKTFENVKYTLNGTTQAALGLNSPTQIVKYNGMYFIVNTFSNMILSSTDMENWNLIEPPNGEDFNLSHSLAFDGKNLVITDTDNKRMLSYEYTNGKFTQKEIFNDNGLDTRFHYVTYNKATDTYYAIASEFGDNTKTYEFKIKDGQFVSPSGGPLVGEDIKNINGSNYINDNNSYARSLTIEGNNILMPIHNTDKSSEILVMDSHFNTKKTIKVPDNIGGVTCIKKVDDYYVLTSSTNKNGTKSPNISVAKNLEDFETGNFKTVDLSNYVDTSSGPIPYFIESFDDANWLTINNSKTPICYIEVDNSGNVTLTNTHLK